MKEIIKKYLYSFETIEFAVYCPPGDTKNYNVFERILWGDFLEERVDYSRRYYPNENIFLVTGHTPTVYIDGWRKPEVYRKNGHIVLDCACVAGGKLAAFCEETEEVIYVRGGRDAELV